VNTNERHERFAEMHKTGCFVMPNPWDAGTARLLAAHGAKALGTTSAGLAFTLGRTDMGTVTRDEALTHAQTILAATPLPVSGDFENGFGDRPDDVAETVRLAGEVGLSGCSIEDTVMEGTNPAYEFDLAVERIAAGVDAARRLSRPFVFCARADGVMNGHYDTDEAIRRLQAFENAGADLLYAPLPPSMEELSRIASSVSKPINALVAGPFTRYSLPDFAAIDVRRLSVGSALARATHAIVNQAARSLANGNFSDLQNGASGSEIDALLEKGASLTASKA